MAYLALALIGSGVSALVWTGLTVVYQRRTDG